MRPTDLFPLKLAVVRWRRDAQTVQHGLPMRTVLDGLWNEDDPLVPLARIVNRVVAGPPLTRSPRRRPVITLPFSVYISRW